MDKKEELINNLFPDKNKESDSDSNNAVVPSDNDSVGNYSNPSIDKDKPNIPFNKELFNEILDFGFEEEKISLAMKLTSDKQQIIDLIMKMNEDEEFYRQIKANAAPHHHMEMPVIKGEYKMVIVVREDLGMGVGKIAAQVGHAVLGCYKLACSKSLISVHQWEGCGTPKIVCGCQSLEEMISLQKKADETGINSFMVHDAGRTQVPEGSATCIAFGPELVSKIDLLTGKLKLL